MASTEKIRGGDKLGINQTRASNFAIEGAKKGESAKSRQMEWKGLSGVEWSIRKRLISKISTPQRRAYMGKTCSLERSPERKNTELIPWGKKQKESWRKKGEVETLGLIKKKW